MSTRKRISILNAILALALLISGCSNAIRTTTGFDSNVSDWPQDADIAPGSILADSNDAAQIQQDSTGELTHSQAIALALAKNPELRSFSWDVRIAGAHRLRAGLLPNPELAFEVEGFGGTGGRSGFNGAETTVAISQPIELGGKRSKRIKIADADKRRVQWDYQAKRLEVYAKASRAFAGVLAAQQELQLARDQVDLAEKLSDTVARRVEAGKDSPVESTKARIELASSQVRLRKASAQIELTKRQLTSLWTTDKSAFTEAVGQLDDLIPPGPYETLREATLLHPSVRRWDDEIEAKSAAVELARAQSIPDISVMGGVKRFEEAGENTFVLGLMIPIPTSSRNKAGRMEAIYVSAKTLELKKDSLARILEKMAEAHTRLVNAYDQAVALREEILPNAEEAFHATLTGYEQGKFDYLNVLDSQRTLFDLKRQIITTLLEYHQARADVESMINRQLD